MAGSGGTAAVSAALPLPLLNRGGLGACCSTRAGGSSQPRRATRMRSASRIQSCRQFRIASGTEHCADGPAQSGTW